MPAWVRFAKYNLQIRVLIHSATSGRACALQDSARFVVPRRPSFVPSVLCARREPRSVSLLSQPYFYFGVRAVPRGQYLHASAVVTCSQASPAAPRPSLSRAPPYRVDPRWQSTIRLSKPESSGRYLDDIYMAGANKLDDLLDWCIELERRSLCGCFPPRTTNALLQRSPAFLLQSRKSSRFSHVTVSSIADESACVRLADPELLPPSTLAAVRAAEAARKTILASDDCCSLW